MMKGLKKKVITTIIISVVINLLILRLVLSWFGVKMVNIIYEATSVSEKFTMDVADILTKEIKNKGENKNV